jgi:uncharacterized protein
MVCPICQKPVAIDDPNMPFCSDRCRVLDIANWASEKYTIPAVEDDPDLEDAAREDLEDLGR